MIERLTQYRYVKAKSFTSGRKAGQPTVIFIHTTEGSEGRHSAEDGAAYDARRTDGVSAHFMVDQDSVIQEVSLADEAHAARQHGNDVGIQIEVCGRAGQTATQWADEASLGTIEQLATLCVHLRAAFPGRFPLVNLTFAQLRAGKNGFAEHYDATRAWPEDHGDHTDPGPNFPWSKLFNLIEEKEIDMTTVDLSDDAIDKIVDKLAARLGLAKLTGVRTVGGTLNALAAATGETPGFVNPIRRELETWEASNAVPTEPTV